VLGTEQVNAVVT